MYKYKNDRKYKLTSENNCPLNSFSWMFGSFSSMMKIVNRYRVTSSDLFVFLN